MSNTPPLDYANNGDGRPNQPAIKPVLDIAGLAPAKAFNFDLAITTRLENIHNLRREIATQLLDTATDIDSSERRRIIAPPFLREVHIIELYQSANLVHQEFCSSKFYTSRAANIQYLSKEIEDLTERRNRSATLFLSTCEDRTREVSEAKEFFFKHRTR